MIETDTLAASPVSNDIKARTAKAESIATQMRFASGSRALSIDLDGVTLRRDTVSIASGGRLLGEAQALKSAQANAQEAASLLQAADAALSDIADKLERAETVATEATATDLSAIDRARLDHELATLTAEIDEIATSASFNGVKLLDGGATASDPFEVSFRVGSGATAADDIAVSIDPASTSSLSAGLDTADLTSAAAASTTLTDVQSAIDAANDIRGAVRGTQTRVAIAAGSAGFARDATESAAAERSDVQVDVDFARLLGRQIVKEADITLTDPEAQFLRQALMDASYDTGNNAQQDKFGSGAKAPDPRGSGAREIPPKSPPETSS